MAAFAAGGLPSTATRARPRFAAVCASSTFSAAWNDFQRFGVLILLEKQLAPRRVDGGVVRRQAVRIAVEVVGRLVVAERARRGAEPRESRGRARARRIDHALQRLTCLRPAAEAHLQQAEFERLVTGRIGTRLVRPDLLGFGIASAGHVRACAQERRAAVRDAGQQALDLVVASFGQGGRRRVERAAGCRRFRRTALCGEQRAPTSAATPTSTSTSAPTRQAPNDRTRPSHVMTVRRAV